MAGVATSGVILSTCTLAAWPQGKSAWGTDDEPVSSFGDGCYRRSMDSFASGKGIAKAESCRVRLDCWRFKT